jgi:RHS repeat-associated protein
MRWLAQPLLTLALLGMSSASAAPKDKLEVELFAPTAGSIHTAPAAVVLSAVASSRQKNRPVVRVEFYAGANLIGAVPGPQPGNVYNLPWANVAAGVYAITAKAINDKDDTDVSEPAVITVNAPPAVSLTSPANNAVFNFPATVTLSASAVDPDGTVQKVDFFQGTTLIGTASAPPYSIALADLPSGRYSFNAVATDNHAATATSTAVAVVINTLPIVSITSPATGTSSRAPASIPITIDASDADGTIGQVELYANGSLIATLTAAPYTFTWTGVPIGTYALSARAIDDNNAQALSAEAAITVQQRAMAMYFIHTDHLNTPRMIADADQKTVWQWEQAEPFGVNVPNENPSGLGEFEFPLRFPGQYADKETGLIYNFFRDYDVGTGRYAQSDPVGLAGGLQTYGYAGQNPLRIVDRNGLLNSVDSFGVLEGGSFGIGGALPLTQSGFGLGGGIGIDMRACCGPDNMIYTEFVAVVKGGPSYGGSGRASPASMVTIVRVGQLPACVARGTLETVLTVDVQVFGGTVQADLKDMRLEAGMTAGSGASAVVNLVSYTYPLWKTPTGNMCSCKPS